MTSKPDESEYEKLYLVSRLVYNGEIEAEKASAKLSGIIGSPDVYNRVVLWYTSYISTGWADPCKKAMPNGLRHFYRSKCYAGVFCFCQAIQG